MGRAIQLKAMRKGAREYAAAANLPKRLLHGGLHQFQLVQNKHAETGVITPELHLIRSQGVNERMSERGVYRRLKRDVKRAHAAIALPL